MIPTPGQQKTTITVPIKEVEWMSDADFVAKGTSQKWALELVAEARRLMDEARQVLALGTWRDPDVQLRFVVRIVNEDAAWAEKGGPAA